MTGGSRLPPVDAARPRPGGIAADLVLRYIQAVKGAGKHELLRVHGRERLAQQRQEEVRLRVALVHLRASASELRG